MAGPLQRTERIQEQAWRLRRPIESGSIGFMGEHSAEAQVQTTVERTSAAFERDRIAINALSADMVRREVAVQHLAHLTLQ